MQTGGVWMAAWLEHAACQLQAVEKNQQRFLVRGNSFEDHAITFQAHGQGSSRGKLCGLLEKEKKPLISKALVHQKNPDDTGEWQNILRVRDLGILNDMSGSGSFWTEFENCHFQFQIWEDFKLNDYSISFLTGLLNKLAQLPAVDMQKAPGSFCFYYKHSPKVVPPSFDAQSLYRLHSDCAKTYTYEKVWSLDGSLAGASCMSTAGNIKCVALKYARKSGGSGRIRSLNNEEDEKQERQRERENRAGRVISKRNITMCDIEVKKRKRETQRKKEYNIQLQQRRYQESSDTSKQQGRKFQIFFWRIEEHYNSFSALNPKCNPKLTEKISQTWDAKSFHRVQKIILGSVIQEFSIKYGESFTYHHSKFHVKKCQVTCS
ncbi:putative signal peptide protein [Puccinia sorghi]|uniref:Putative signal peptide protein n=1 Tax=Puccinia sorghi TaxID=27349 RepID=A0A0L6UKQ8_9BASI|nr:putative signal peptide protein [Puccinia sorghi]